MCIDHCGPFGLDTKGRALSPGQLAIRGIDLEQLVRAEHAVHQGWSDDHVRREADQVARAYREETP